MPNSDSSKNSSSASCVYRSSRCSSPSQMMDDNGSSIQACPDDTYGSAAVAFHPMIHTPPPARTERRLPTRSGSTASLLSPFASLTRRLGAKNKSKRAASAALAMDVSSVRSTPTPVACGSRTSTPADFPPSQLSRSTTPALSLYSTYPRINSSPSSPPSPSPTSSHTPFISQLLGTMSPSRNSSCPSPSSSTSPRMSVAGPHIPMGLTEVLDEPVEEEVSHYF